MLESIPTQRADELARAVEIVGALPAASIAYVAAMQGVAIRPLDEKLHVKRASEN